MNISLCLKTFTLALALGLGSFGFVGNAVAADGERGEAIVGILGEVITGAMEAEQENAEPAEAADDEDDCAPHEVDCDDD